MENYKFLFIVVLIAILDLVSKKYISSFLIVNNGFTKINDFLNVIIVYNHGIVFGIFNDSILMSKIMIIVNTFIMIYVLKLLIEAENILFKIGMSFVLGGGIGNLIEKFSTGYVLDFIDLHINDLHWYVFNIADMFICFGVLILFIFEIKKNKNANTRS